MRGIFATPAQSPRYTIQYTSSKTGAREVMEVPPLDATALISTPSEEGVADKAALSVMPTNEALCNHQPSSVLPPDAFDFREEFAEYTSPIIDQGSCGACWAIASTQAFASRYAFFTNQRVAPLSAAYMLYCTRAATFSPSVELQYGCFGGTLVNAYWFFVLNGVVAAECVKYDALSKWDPSNPDLQKRTIETGGGSKSAVMCPMETCPAPPGGVPQQPWTYKCALSYIVAGTPKQAGASDANIRRDIWRKGPVSTGFEVRQDFLTYWKQLLEGSLSGKQLVYTPQPADDQLNPIIGNHAVQLLGWGSIGQTGYWIVANSWGASNKGGRAVDLVDYGHNGYFLMVRGMNAAALESNVVAGLPLVHPSMVNAIGQPAGNQDVEMCDLIAYAINRDTFVRLGFDVPRELNDHHTMYEYTLPPMKAENSGTIRRFPRCPDNRAYRCPFTDTCVTAPQECGTSIPAQGTVAPVKQLTTKPYLASSREISVKYLAEDEAKKQQRRSRLVLTIQPERGTCRSPFPCALNVLALLTLLVCLLLVLLQTKSKRGG
jgi:hypothetical protein